MIPPRPSPSNKFLDRRPITDHIDDVPRNRLVQPQAAHVEHRVHDGGQHVRGRVAFGDGLGGVGVAAADDFAHR